MPATDSPGPQPPPVPPGRPLHRPSPPQRRLVADLLPFVALALPFLVLLVLKGSVLLSAFQSVRAIALSAAFVVGFAVVDWLVLPRLIRRPWVRCGVLSSAGLAISLAVVVPGFVTTEVVETRGGLRRRPPGRLERRYGHDRSGLVPIGDHRTGGAARLLHHRRPGSRSGDREQGGRAVTTAVDGDDRHDHDDGYQLRRASGR